MQVISRLGAKLGINDSWRGATVSGCTMIPPGKHRISSRCLYPLDTLENVTWTVSDAKKALYADYAISGDGRS